MSELLAPHRDDSTRTREAKQELRWAIGIVLTFAVDPELIAVDCDLIEAIDVLTKAGFEILPPRTDKALGENDGP